MRTVSIVISIVVVIVLNANFFQVYKSLSTNEVQRKLIVDQGPKIIERSKSQAPPTSTPPNLQAALQQSREEIETLSNTYQGFGFTPLSLQQVQSFVSSLSPKQTWDQWWGSRKNNVVTLIGWAIMVMLLSAGAPFWQDALESLFGIKNLLRQKSGTQNIETQSGTGQPKE
jgi:hypothetical protein